MADTTYFRSIASMSWIDPRTGLPEVDEGGHPGDHPWRSTILGEKVYRFANFLEAFITMNDHGDVIGHGFSSTTSRGKSNGMYRSPSFLHIPSEPFDSKQSIHIGSEPVRFVQLVGCCTRSPEVIGKVVGSLVTPPILPIPIVGGYVGGKVAHAVKSFPPIWTELELCIYKDGTITGAVLKHSLFPSHSFYIQDFDFNSAMNPDVYSVFSRYDGMPNYQKWYDYGWGPLKGGGAGPREGNPWDYTK